MVIARPTIRAASQEAKVAVGQLIDGQWLSGGSDRLEVTRKDTGQILASLPVSQHQHLELAISAAARAIGSRPLQGWERYQILALVAASVKRESERLSLLIAQEVGKTIREARSEVEAGQSALQFAAEESKRVGGETIDLAAVRLRNQRFGFTIRVPAGPVCAITPFNAPFNQACHKIGSSIAAGCPVVIKPSSLTPLSTIALAELFMEAELPPSYLHVLIGSSEVGEWMLNERRFRRYLFTGSRAIGEHIHNTVGLRPTLLELGSNAATIVHLDADLEAAAAACALSGFGLAGQVCTSVQRILVHDSVMKRFQDLLAERTRALRVGDPLDESTDVGPLVTESAAQRIDDWVTEAVNSGAQLVEGGRHEGAFYWPTILSNVRNSMRVVCEEVFGPVVSLIPYSSIQDAIAVANDTPYGLQGGIFTASLDVAFLAVRTFEVGGLMVNDTSRFRVPHQPYGGVKDSGLGREGPRYVVQELTDLKFVSIST
jgi:acyl-CoA reductase-like NAD-dependent aldehyde dehydrogenase